jgi:hypothetical protein
MMTTRFSWFRPFIPLVMLVAGHHDQALALPGYSLNVKNGCVAASRPKPTFLDSDCDYCHKSTPRMLAYQSGNFIDEFCPAGVIPEPPPPSPPPAQPTGPLSFSGPLGKFVNERRWVVNCGAKNDQSTQRYKFSVRSVSGKKLPFRIKLSVSRGDQATSVVDPINQDKQASDWGSLDLGDGDYLLSISKFSANEQLDGKIAFSVKHACESANGNRTQLKLKKLP